MTDELRQKVFRISNDDDFLSVGRELFSYQYERNTLFKSFIDNLGKQRQHPASLEEFTFLPVEFFRNHKVITGDCIPELVFESSGTTGILPGRHFICDVSLYEESFTSAFKRFYGDPGNFVIAALLPSYIERSGSSLVYMVNRLIAMSGDSRSGFYRDNRSEMIANLRSAVKEGKKALLLGVTFALIDLAFDLSPDLSGVIVMETGGMKGRRKEITRSELHEILCSRLNTGAIHSEYGMTELLSQAYSFGDEKFHCPPWMKIILRDPHDPLTLFTEPGRSGGINVIDLANIHSCPFIATGDLGRLHSDGSFEVLGRFDNSDIRGCNLMIQ